MRSLRVKAVLIALVVSAIGLAIAVTVVHARPQRPSYHIVRMNAAFGHQINNNGEVVGMRFVRVSRRGGMAYVQHGVIWRSHKLTDLAVARDESCEAQAINEKGHVLVTSGMGENHRRVFLWVNGKRTQLGSPGESAVYGSAINAADLCVGQLRVDKEKSHACEWVGGRTIDLGTLGGKNSIARGINSRGEIVGSAETATGATHATLWRDGKPLDLGTLGGKSSAAYGINDQSVIVGEADDSHGHTRAFKWVNGKMSALPVLKGEVNSSANAINNFGTIVGNTSGPSYTELATVWRGAAIFDLNTCIRPNRKWLLGVATGINSKGQIVGFGDHLTEPRSLLAFVLTPQ